LASVSSPIPADEVQKQLNQILLSRGFRNSKRLKRFLNLAVERTLAGQPDQLKEYVLGRDAFDRGSDYDPRNDSIVRVEAQRLRRKLREYYEIDGRLDPILIAFHPGSYVPEFSRRVDSPPVDSPKPDPLTVAVLPFSNLSPEPEQDYFCDGITEDIINALTTIPELKVIGRTSAFALDQTSHDLRELGARLGAGTVIEGSARKSGDMLRVSVKVVDSESRQALWSKVFDRQTGDVFSIEDEIARSVAGTLRISLASGQLGELGQKAPSVEAYNLYLKARQAWNQMNLEGFQTAIERFDRVISLYPDFALPYAGLATAYSWLALWGARRPRDVLPKSKTAALEALRLDPALAHAHTALGTVLFFFEWKWQEGMAGLQKALELQPGYASGHHAYGGALLAQGRFQEASHHFEQAARLDPLSIRMNRSLGYAYYVHGRGAEAEKWMKAAVALDVDSAESRYMLARLYLQQGRNEEALQEALTYEKAYPLSPLPLGVLGTCFARNHDSTNATKILERLTEMSSAQYVDPLATAFVHLGLGDVPATLDSLEKSLAERSPFAIFLKVDPLFDPIRSEPRFAALVASLNWERQRPAG
jgi:TolB-like protein